MSQILKTLNISSRSTSMKNHLCLKVLSCSPEKFKAGTVFILNTETLIEGINFLWCISYNY